MNNEQIIERTKNYVRESLEHAEPGHDWFHIERVCKLAKIIGRNERADMFIVEMAALLHDIADYKFGDVNEEMKNIVDLLKSFSVDQKRIKHISKIIKNTSFRGSGEPNRMKTIEGKVVQDADRLDALGAIGIARAFSFAGHRKNPLFDPEIQPKRSMKFGTYKKMKSPAINHFYEKLLLLKGQMNTETAKKIAEERHKFMEQFLDKFFKEWKGKDQYARHKAHPRKPGNRGK